MLGTSNRMVVAVVKISCEVKLSASIPHPTLSRNMVKAKAGRFDGMVRQVNVSRNALELRIGVEIS